MRIALFALFFTVMALFAAPAPAPAEFKVDPVVPETKPAETDPRKIMLARLIDAGVLMLEGKAYRQFIQAFVDDEDRRGFEKVFGKKGFVDYNEWGRDKGEAMLRVLKLIQGKEPLWFGEKACFANENLPKKNFSFAFAKGAWYIENRSNCPTIEIKKIPETPKR